MRLTDEQQQNVRAIVMDLARAGATAELSDFLDHGVQADEQDEFGNSLLMLATYHGHVETVGMLLRKGADPNLLNAKNQAPLAGALFKGEQEIVTYLKEAGADLDIGTPTARQAAELFQQDL